MIQEEKIAIARVFSDIIKADGQLSLEQITLAESVFEEYHVTQEHIAQSRFMTYVSALRTLKGLSRLEKKALKERAQRVAIGNHSCNMNEAMLLVAMDYVLDSDIPMLSVPTIERTIGSEISITYMEKEYHDLYNEELSAPNRYRLICNACKLEGMHFSYVPKITENFTMLDQQKVNTVLRYMSPNLTEEEAANVSRRMGEITTSEFYMKVMHLPMRSVAHDLSEFLLISVGISMTPYCQADGEIKYYKEYLCLPIEGTVLETIDAFIEKYKGFVTTQPNISASALPSQKSFYDFEYYKLFFDFLLTPPPVVPDLIFLGQEPKTGKHAIAFRFGANEKHIVLSPKEYEAFFEIVQGSLRNKAKGMPIGLNRTNLAPVISHIRQKITAEFPEIAMAERFKPERDGNVYSINIQDAKVYVRHYESVTEWREEQM